MEKLLEQNGERNRQVDATPTIWSYITEASDSNHKRKFYLSIECSVWALYFEVLQVILLQVILF